MPETLHLTSLITESVLSEIMYRNGLLICKIVNL